MAGRRTHTDSPNKSETPSKTVRSLWDSIGLRTHRGIDAVKRGLPILHLELFLETTQLPKVAVLKVLKLSPGGYQERLTAGRLTPLESERLWRLAKVHKKSVDLFEGDAKQAALWLKTPQRALQGVSPLRCATTEPGASEVEELIGRIEYGVAS